jgi:hypothetical protein
MAVLIALYRRHRTQVAGEWEEISDNELSERTPLV